MAAIIEEVKFIGLFGMCTNNDAQNMLYYILSMSTLYLYLNLLDYCGESQNFI